MSRDLLGKDGRSRCEGGRTI